MAQRLTIYTSFGNLTLLVADDWKLSVNWGSGSCFRATSTEDEVLAVPWNEIRGLYLDPNPDPFLVGLANPAAEGEAPDA